MERLWYVIGTLAVLVLIAVSVRGGQEPVAAAVTETPTPTAEETILPTPTPRPVIKPRATIKPSPVPTYWDVAAQYAGHRIQFDNYCQAFPVDNSYNDGTQVMLDNRSPDDRVVTIGDRQYNLRGYGWNVIEMTAESLPATWAIDCGTAKNVGKIVIEPLVTASTQPTATPASSSQPLVSGSPVVSPTASVSPSILPTTLIKTRPAESAGSSSRASVRLGQGATCGLAHGAG